MQVLMNLSMLGPRPTGLGVYARHCAEAVSRGLKCEVIASGEMAKLAPVYRASPENIVLGAGKLAALRRWAWARGVADAPGRLLYSPTHHGLPGQSNQVLTVHDLIALRHPKQHPVQSMYFKHVLPRQLKRCRAVFTVSETTKIDLHERYGLSLSSIHVVPNGVDRTVFKPLDAAQNRQTPREPFLLMVGAAYSHKNVDEILDIADLWKTKYQLRIASSRGKYRQHLEQRVAELGLGDRVKFLDYLSFPELVGQYQRCAAFVYPSQWEGFGIPPLEAMACGATVIASDIAAHREVLGRHARLVPLGNKAAWEAAFASLPEVGAPAASNGLDDIDSPLKRFTWEASAATLIQSLQMVEPSLKTAS